MNKAISKYGSTTILRLAIFAIGVAVLALCVFGLPAMWNAVPNDYEYADIAKALRSIIFVMYASAIPFFYALWQTMLLLNYIDKNTAFSKLSVKALRHIMYCALSVSILYAASLPFFYVWAQHDDAPGLIVIGMIISGAAFTTAVFSAVLQKLLLSAIAMKTENDLTV